MERKWEAKLKQIEERASHYERNPLSPVYRPRLSKSEEPPSIWKLFHRQTHAFNFVKSCKEEVHVFALEYKVGDGQRIYLVTTYAELWFYYKSRKNLLHCYEVIPENAVCKLYFDLEFNKLANQEADGKKMVALLIEHVCKALQELYGVHCSAEDVFNLDSSTDEKFSRHLIFQLHDVAFKDNIHVGNFVRKILQPAFHLIASEDDDSISETTGHRFSHFPETPIKQGISFSEMSSDEGRGESRTRNSKEQERLESAEQSSPDLSFLVVKNNVGEKHLFVDFAENIEGYNCSPYPEIDQFVRSLVDKNGIKGGIRRWSYFFPEELLVYDICKYRWCENIGRAHKSNNIMILVDLKNEVWYQKCHDPVCKAENFKSACFPLPAEVSLLFLLKEEEEFTAAETMNSDTQNPHEPPSGLSSKDAISDAAWDSGLDEADFVEAAEDAELAEAAECGLLGTAAETLVPDEPITQVLQE
ncbi:DNA-directed primase/polymerase protein isoform X3 [Ailuropoda melanoleuca]|uniref:DNA-directed primase/polymerase protein isoform X3 n=1 Tax=Ailuropoda melanoleuca TaxID=9646 RepID=UPI001494A8FF|nr:DNA-directed primase/polymerase protein isoform X3 [Ailuropoda melanoleuca]